MNYLHVVLAMFNDVEHEFCEGMKKKSIVEIFHEMDYEEEVNAIKPNGTVSSNERGAINELCEVLKVNTESKSFDNAVEAAIKAQNKWENLSTLQRANSLHNVWKVLKTYSDKLSKSKNEALILLDYFDFYSDLTIQAEEYKSWKPQGVVLVVFSQFSSFFVLAATIPAALAVGCSVIVLAPERNQVIPLFLKEIIAKAGLFEDLFSVVTNFDEKNLPVCKKISQVFFCGSYLSAQKFYIKDLSQSFSFFCLNHTAAVILESGDTDAAVDKIVRATWGENSLFGVSTIIVQESIYETFLNKLKYRMEQFMIENKNSSLFKDVNIAEKINKIILEALNAGACVEKSSSYENIWSPAVIINYQNESIDEDVPILKVLLCRTAKEGVYLVNNCHYNLGVSIWSEISSQALEISSMLVCPNVWINCHGIFQATEPLQSGGCVLGGSDGILEYMLFTLEDSHEESKTDKVRAFNTEKLKVLQTAISAKQAFGCWQDVKNKRKYIKDIAHTLASTEELSNLSEMISTYAHFGNTFNFLEKDCSREFFVVKKKIPVGVILLIINIIPVDIKLLVSLITLPIVLGNAVIIILKDENCSVKLLIEYYNKVLPKNLLNIIIGIKAGINLASDPNIQAIWLFHKNAISTEFLQAIKNHSSKNLKPIWVIPKNISISQHFFQKKCLQYKVVWLPRIDQFP